VPPLPLTASRTPVKILKARRRARRRASLVFGEALFRDALVRERKRADRLDHPFVLLLVEVASAPAPEAPAVWPTVIEALAAAKRETDLLGWLEQDAVLGVILPDLAEADAAVPAALQHRLRRVLDERLDETSLGRVSVKVYGYAGQPWVGGHGPRPVDPLLERQPGLRAALRRAAKRGLDVVGSLALLALFSPVFAAVAAIVKLTSPGPVFYRQERVGQGGKPFRMLKFRSMYTDCDPTLHRDYVSWFITSSGQRGLEDGAVFKLTQDPRVTRVGHVLRKTSLDELPQFLNVLRGEMSLVGPRPPLPYEVERYQPWHRRRVLEARPGITGLWQVTGRSRTTFDEMVRLDLRYAKRHTLWTDIKILAATPRAVISGKGAA
jgi:exopolysaccharide biosynthesis polyprenyl glycosylphosphotransferase